MSSSTFLRTSLSIIITPQQREIARPSLVVQLCPPTGRWVTLSHSMIPFWPPVPITTARRLTTLLLASLPWDLPRTAQHIELLIDYASVEAPLSTVCCLLVVGCVRA